MKILFPFDGKLSEENYLKKIIRKKIIRKKIIGI